MSINTDLGHPDQPPLATPLSFSKTVLPVLIVTLLSLTATMIAGKITSAAVNTRLTEYFNHQADQVSNTFYSNLDSHITALEGLRGLWNAQGFYNHDTFHAYINSLSLEDTYGSGVSSFFFITPVSKNQKNTFTQKQRSETGIPAPYASFTLHPDSTADTLYPVTYVEPVEGRESTVGLDFGTFLDRLAAIEYARDNNDLATTKPLIFVATDKPGFFYFLPLYNPKLPTERIPERKTAFAGVVGAAFRSESAFNQVFGGSDPYPYLDFQIYQGDATTPDRLLHDHDPNFTAQNPRFETTRMIRLKNQAWTIKIQGKPGLALMDSEQKLPALVFASGILLTTLMLVFSTIRLIKIFPRHRSQQ